MIRRPPRFPLFPYTTRFRSAEALVIAGVGAALGVALAWGGVEIFNRAIVDTDPPSWIDIRLHPPVMLFAVALARSEEHTSELQSRQYLVCPLLLGKLTSVIF